MTRLWTAIPQSVWKHKIIPMHQTWCVAFFFWISIQRKGDEVRWHSVQRETVASHKGSLTNRSVFYVTRCSPWERPCFNSGAFLCIPNYSVLLFSFFSQNLFIFSFFFRKIFPPLYWLPVRHTTIWRYSDSPLIALNLHPDKLLLQNYFYRQKHSEDWAAFLWFGRFGKKIVHWILSCTAGDKTHGVSRRRHQWETRQAKNRLTSYWWRRLELPCVLSPSVSMLSTKTFFKPNLISAYWSKQSENLQNLEKSENKKAPWKKGRYPCPFYILIRSFAINVH